MIERALGERTEEDTWHRDAPQRVIFRVLKLICLFLIFHRFFKIAQAAAFESDSSIQKSAYKTLAAICEVRGHSLFSSICGIIIMHKTGPFTNSRGV